MAYKSLTGFDASNQPIINVGDPTLGHHAVNLQYLQNFLSGLDIKSSVRAASTGNINLSAPGASIDGVAMSNGDRFLAKNQTTASQNGIYVWVGASSAATRATDADSSSDVTAGMLVPHVAEGTVNADTAWVLTTNDPITLGTTALTFTQFGAGGGATYVAGNGLTDSPTNTFNVGQGTGITVAADSVSIDTSVVTRKFSTTVGNGSATSIAVTHNLGTRNVVWQMFDSTGFSDVVVDAVRTDTNTITFNFAVAPTSGQYTVIVMG